jgi:hypothetical protein
MEQGIPSGVQKPFNIEEIAQIVQSALESWLKKSR